MAMKVMFKKNTKCYEERPNGIILRNTEHNTMILILFFKCLQTEKETEKCIKVFNYCQLTGSWIIFMSFNIFFIYFLNSL